MKSPILTDAYAGDLGGPDKDINIDKMAFYGLPWVGIWLKGNQGTYYPWNIPKHLAWFKRHWVAAKAPRAVTPEGTPRYGFNWFRGVYAYLDMRQRGDEQARSLLQLVREAGGGWNLDGACHNTGDLPAFLDVEAGGNPERPGAGAIEQRCRDFNDELAKNGLPPSILYGNVYLFENGVKFENTGCQALIVARYTANLPPEVYTRIGCPPEKLLGWQYAGTAAGDKVVSLLKGYESTTPAGNLDLTAVFAPNASGTPDGGEPAIQRLRDLCAQAA